MRLAVLAPLQCLSRGLRQETGAAQMAGLGTDIDALHHILGGARYRVAPPGSVSASNGSRSIGGLQPGSPVGWRASPGRWAAGSACPRLRPAEASTSSWGLIGPGGRCFPSKARLRAWPRRIRSLSRRAGTRIGQRQYDARTRCLDRLLFVAAAGILFRLILRRSSPEGARYTSPGQRPGYDG